MKLCAILSLIHNSMTRQLFSWLKCLSRTKEVSYGHMTHEHDESKKQVLLE